MSLAQPIEGLSRMGRGGIGVMRTIEAVEKMPGFAAFRHHTSCSGSSAQNTGEVSLEILIRWADDVKTKGDSYE